MSIVTLEEVRDQLSMEGVGTHDDALIAQKIEAAQAHVERLLGFKIEDEFGGEDQPPIPEPLREAVLQLAAWWYSQREAGLVGHRVEVAPYSVQEIVAEFREWSF